MASHCHAVASVPRLALGRPAAGPAATARASCPWAAVGLPAAAAATARMLLAAVRHHPATQTHPSVTNIFVAACRHPGCRSAVTASQTLTGMLEYQTQHAIAILFTVAWWSTPCKSPAAVPFLALLDSKMYKHLLRPGLSAVRPGRLLCMPLRIYCL